VIFRISFSTAKWQMIIGLHADDDEEAHGGISSLDLPNILKRQQSINRRNIKGRRRGAAYSSSGSGAAPSAEDPVVCATIMDGASGHSSGTHLSGGGTSGAAFPTQEWGSSPGDTHHQQHHPRWEGGNMF